MASSCGPGNIVVACGGGGPPVVDAGGGRREGMEAVVDKDLTAAVLALEPASISLFILTKVDAVYETFGTPDEPSSPTSSEGSKRWRDAPARPL